MKNLQAAARALGLQLHVLHASTERDFDAAFVTLSPTAVTRAIVRDNYRRSAPTPPAPKSIVDTLLEKFGP